MINIAHKLTLKPNQKRSSKIALGNANITLPSNVTTLKSNF